MSKGEREEKKDNGDVDIQSPPRNLRRMPRSLKQKAMDFQISGGSSLPWILALEELGCSRAVEPAVLQDLLEEIPLTSNDIGKARELLYLKRLESLFGQGARANLVSSASSKRVRFDLSDSCEIVLQQILREISLSEQNPSVPDLSKWDLESFIKHKNSNLLKCTLKQLKDAILTGSLSIPATLKEKSGLPVGIHIENQAPANDGKCSTPIAEISDKDCGSLMPGELPDENSVPVNRKTKAGESPAEQLDTTSIELAKKNKYDIICNEHDSGLDNGVKGLCGLLPTNEDTDKLGQTVPETGKTVGEAEDVADISRDKDGCDGDKKKRTSLSSQCTFGQDELTCVKCEKGGNLLSCYSGSCPIVIHESCLGSDKRFDAREKFYCPLCAYSRALSKCKEAKKHASMMRKELTTFMGLLNDSKKQSCGSSTIDGSCLKQNDALPKTNELNQINVVEKVSDHQHRKKHEQARPSDLPSDHSPPFGRKAVGSSDRIVQSLERDKQDAQGIRQESQSPLGPKRKRIAAEAIHNSQIETKRCEVSETSGRVKHADVRSKKGVTYSPETGSQSCHSSDSEEISEEEDEDSGASESFISARIQERQNLHPGKPQSIKKRLPWTSKEEDVLQKGVHIFSCPQSNTIPWKKILTFGEDVFDLSRTTMDLKEKWWNMCNGHDSNEVIFW